jgi:hypothetical protein
MKYKTPYSGYEALIIRRVSLSPDGQFLASGTTDGFCSSAGGSDG